MRPRIKMLPTAAYRSLQIAHQMANRSQSPQFSGCFPYASHDYQEVLTKYQIQASMSRKGNCYDNAAPVVFESLPLPA
jgi:transposase InsO family protein